MKIIVTIISFSLSLISINAQITYTALKEAIQEEKTKEFCSLLFDQGFTVYEKDDNSIYNYVFAHNFKSENKMASMWAYVCDHEGLIQSDGTKIRSIVLISFGQNTFHDYLVERIKKYCIYRGVEERKNIYIGGLKDGYIAQIYTKSNVVFHIFSIQGKNYIATEHSSKYALLDVLDR